MIDLKLLALESAALPTFNESVVQNTVINDIRDVEKFLNDIFVCASESFPKGFKYLGGRRCTPAEQFREIVRPLKPSKRFELTRSDVYLMKYSFSYNGEKIRPFYIFLPFINEGGLIYLRGTQYKVTPVIGGKVFNIEEDNIFMPAPRLRIGFEQFTVSCVLNNRVVHGKGVMSKLFNLEKSERSKLSPTILHYTLAEYGLTTTLKKYFNIDVKIGTNELDNLPSDQWHVYRSRQLPPINKVPGYNPVCEIRLAVPVNQYYPLLDGVMGTIFYIFDNCVEPTSELDDLDKPLLWLRILDRFIFKVAKTEKKQFETMTSHINSIKAIMDPIQRRVLRNDGIECETMFDLYRYIILNYQDIIIHNDMGSMYYKELTTLKYLLYDVVYNIFTAMYALQDLPENIITSKRIVDILQKSLNRERIFKVKGHGELVPASIATDCLPYSATCNLISYTKAIQTASNRGRGTSNDPNMLLHPSQAEVSTYQWITKREPTGRGKVNPFITFGNGTYVVPNPKRKAEIDNLRELLKPKIFYDKVEILETDDEIED